MSSRNFRCFSIILAFDFLEIVCIPELEGFSSYLKAQFRGADWINKSIKKKRIKQGSIISLYSEIHEDDNDLIPFILETKDYPRA